MPHSKVQLVLVLARKSRGADHWDKDDYDVRFGDRSGPVVGRIMRHPQAPPWFWTITARGQTPSVYNRGYAASRGQAMRHFRRVRRGHPTKLCLLFSADLLLPPLRPWMQAFANFPPRRESLAEALEASLGHELHIERRWLDKSRSLVA
jgi:hypothetical protein